MSKEKNFFDKLSKNFKKYVPIYADKVKSTAKTYGQIGKETLDIKIYENKINKLHHDIGTYLDKNRKKFKGKLDGTVEGYLKSIEALNKKISAKKQSIKDIKSTAKAGKGKKAAKKPAKKKVVKKVQKASKKAR